MCGLANDWTLTVTQCIYTRFFHVYVRINVIVLVQNITNEVYVRQTMTKLTKRRSTMLLQEETWTKLTLLDSFISCKLFFLEIQ